MNIRTLDLALGAALLSSLAACADDGPYQSIAEMPNLHLIVGPGETDDELRIALAYDDTDGDELRCAELFGAGLAGELNGEPLAIDTVGYRLHGFVGEFCDEPKLSAVVPRDGAAGATIRVWDDSTEIVAEYPDLFAPRGVELVAPDDGALHVDDEVELAWTPASDQIGRYLLVAFDDADPDVERRAWQVDDAAIDGPTIRFTVPHARPDVPDAEPASGDLVVSPWSYRPTASRCDGADACIGSDVLTTTHFPLAADFIAQPR